MGKDHTYNWIVIDDSKLDCFIAEKIIKNTGRSESVKSFFRASEALEFIKENNTDNKFKTILLLDLQMPVMNGFEFLDEFEKLPEEIKKNYVVYVINSQVNEQVLERVHNYKSVKQFLNKPVTSNNLLAMFN